MDALPPPVVNVEAVLRLNEIELLDGSPCIESAPASINYELASEHNPVEYADAAAFSGDAFKGETNLVAEMERLLSNGEYFVNMLYTFRSSSRAFPPQMTSAKADAEMGRAM